MSLRVEISHALPIEEVQKRMAAFGEYLTNKHHIQVTWSGLEAKAAGKYLVVTIDGRMKISDKTVVFEGSDPGFLFRSRAKEYLTNKIKSYLDTRTPVSDLPRK